jgi:hypothetical protein
MLLPSGQWLRDNGYAGLMLAIAKRPELFAHIPQMREKQPQVADWTTVVQSLIDEHGHIPTPGWLLSHGYERLYRAMRRTPDAFRQYKRHTKSRTPQQWVKVAKRLIAKYGTIPGYTWLKSRKIIALYFAVRNHPEEFTHLTQRVAA